MAPAFATERIGAAGPVLFGVAAAMVVFAPLVRGGNRPLPLLVLECAALVLLAIVALGGGRGAWSGLPVAMRWAIAILVGAVLAQLVPMPFEWWARLPGREPYARVVELAGGVAQWRPASIHPLATEYAALALLPAIAMVLAVRALPRRLVRRLALVFVAVAACEAALGILQVGAGRDSVLLLGNRFGGGVATGTYVNKNHFAALMAMALPVMVAFWAAEALPARDAQGEVLREHPRHADARFARRIFWSLLIVLVMAALLMTRSRGGIGFGFAAFGAAAATLVWNAGTRRTRALLGVVAGAALLLAGYAGLTPVLERFSADELALGYEGRARLAAVTMRAALDFLPIGSGLGTFADVFRRYQDAGLSGYIDHAHNDYAEAFLELGLAAVAVVALLAIAYARRWKVVAHRHSRKLGRLPLCAGIGMAAFAAHGLVDFNFHIPANALYFALLAGFFLHEPHAPAGAAIPGADPGRAAAAPLPAAPGPRTALRTPPR